MAALGTSSMRSLKVKLDNDIRRVQVELPNGGSAADKLKALRDAVGACFGMDVADLPVLKYRAGEDDICTLMEASVENILQLTTHGPLYLFASASDGYTSPGVGSSDGVDLADVVQIQEEGAPEKSDEGESLVAPLLAMGFDESDAISAIEKTEGNLEFAIAILLKGSQPQQRSFLGKLFPRFSIKRSTKRDLTERDEVDAFLLSDSAAIVEANGINLRSNVDTAMTQDVAMDYFQHLDRETEQIESAEALEHNLDQPQRITSKIGEDPSSEVQVLVETYAEFYDAEHMAMDSNSEDGSLGTAVEDAFERSVNASPVDKGSVLASRFFSAIRTRQFLPQSISSSSADVTSFDRMQRFLSDSLSAVRSQMKRRPFPEDSVVYQDQSA